MGVDISSKLIYGWDEEEGFCEWFYEEAFPYTKYYVSHGLENMTEDERLEHWDIWHEDRYDIFHHVNLYEDWGQAFGELVEVPRGCSIERMNEEVIKAKERWEKTLTDMFIPDFDYAKHFDLPEPGLYLLAFIW